MVCRIRNVPKPPARNGRISAAVGVVEVELVHEQVERDHPRLERDEQRREEGDEKNDLPGKRPLAKA